MQQFPKTAIQGYPAIPTVHKFLDENFRSMAPGFDFILGKQPDTNWLNKAAQRGLITKDSTFNDLFVQSFDQKISAYRTT